jgi:hypothetical protein
MAHKMLNICWRNDAPEPQTMPRKPPPPPKVDRAKAAATAREISAHRAALGLGDMPRTRGECPTIRPCPYVSCRYNMQADPSPDPRVQSLRCPGDGLPSCALDVADEGPHHLDEVAQIMGGISRERVRQIEAAAMGKVRAAGLLTEDMRDGSETWSRWDLARPIGVMFGNKGMGDKRVTAAMRKAIAGVRVTVRDLDAQERAEALAELASTPRGAQILRNVKQ